MILTQVYSYQTVAGSQAPCQPAIVVPGNEVRNPSAISIGWRAVANNHS